MAARVGGGREFPGRDVGVEHPFAEQVRATCAVRDGTCSPERGRSDNEHLGNRIDLRNGPSMPDDHAAVPGNSKIPDRVKLRAVP
jgi:hypothetical protein